MTFSELVDQQLPFFRVKHLQQHAGKKNALFGATLENTILISNKSYEADHLGVVKKNNVEMRREGERYFHAARQTIDFDGYLKDIGFVAFDAKSTEENYWKPSVEQIHQFLYLYRGQLEMSRSQARFFYIIERRIRPRVLWYLVEDLESVKRVGRYDFLDVDLIPSGHGMLVDYRAQLLKSK